MLSTSVAGYRPTYAPQDCAPRREPLELRQGYTQPCLTFAQHGAVVGGASLTAAVLARPTAKLGRFYFLSDVPGESSRIFMSDKRAQFFRVLVDTRWWSGGGSLLHGTVDYALPLALFVCARDWLNACAVGTNAVNGFVAGGWTGAVYTLARHPYDVLRATAEAPGGPKAFRGPADVFVSALKERPAILKGLYTGVSAALLGRTAQYSLQFGLYNALRYDGVYRSHFLLFVYCHMACFFGVLVNYPFLSLRQQLHWMNRTSRGRPQTYRSLFFELRRRHGLTKVYDGFFTSRPWLNTLTPALALFLYDVGSRRYTEYLHPTMKQRAVQEQSLTYKRAPRHIREPEPYEFGRGERD